MQETLQIQYISNIGDAKFNMQIPKEFIISLLLYIIIHYYLLSLLLHIHYLLL